MDRFHHGLEKGEFSQVMAFAGRVRELYAESAPPEENYGTIYGASLHMNDRDRVLFAEAIRAELGPKHPYFGRLADRLISECDMSFDVSESPKDEERREGAPRKMAIG